MKTYSYLIIILILLLGKATAQTISLKIDLEKKCFEHLEIILPKVIITNNGEDSIFFGRHYGVHGPDIRFKIRDVHGNICGTNLIEAYEAVHYYRLAPKSSVYFPLFNYYSIIHGPRSDKTKYLIEAVLKPGGYSIEAYGLNSYSEKYYFKVCAVEDTSEIEILNTAHKLCDEGYINKDDRQKFEGIRLLENLINNTNNSMILLRSIRAWAFYCNFDQEYILQLNNYKNLLLHKLQNEFRDNRYAFWVFNYILNQLKRRNEDNTEFIQSAIGYLPNFEFKNFLEIRLGNFIYPEGLTLKQDKCITY